MKTLTAILFAGGESRRMGVDKATLVINGEPLWSRQLRLLRELGTKRVMISARSRPIWCPPEIEVVLDASPLRGPLSGLAAVLAAITTTHALVLAMDLPLMEVNFLNGLWAGCAAGRGVVPTCDGFLEPLCAIYPASAADVVSAALAGEDFSVHGIVDGLRSRQLLQVIPVASDERPLFLNLNTPAELSVLQARPAFL